MKYSGWILSAFLAALPMTAQAQSDGKLQTQTPRTIVIDVRMVEASGVAAAELEKSSRDRKRVDRLIADGTTMLIAEVELEAADSHTVTTHIGQRVPIQTASLPMAGRPDLRSAPDKEQRDQTASTFAFALPQIQYQNTGISVSATPTAIADGKISLAFNLTLSDFNASQSTLTPIFINRDINTAIIIGDGETAPILNTVQRDGLAPAAQLGHTAREATRFMILLTVHSLN